MWNASFWKAAAERAVKTFVQTYFAIALAGDAVLNVYTFTWTGPELGIALGATLLSVVTSVLSAMGGNPGPSLANESVAAIPAHRSQPNV
jgi:hypothetical protein